MAGIVIYITNIEIMKQGFYYQPITLYIENIITFPYTNNLEPIRIVSILSTFCDIACVRKIPIKISGNTDIK